MNPTQRHHTAEQRRQQIAALYLQGHYQSAIAQQLGVSQQQVSYDLKAVQKTWLASALRDFDQAKAQELAKIDEAERAYWAGWERSCQQQEVTLTKQVDGKEPRTEASIRRETPVGDPRFLDGVLKCITQRCDLLGLSTATEATKALGAGLAALLTQARATVRPSAPLVEA
jgi:hypothetical protein